MLSVEEPPLSTQSIASPSQPDGAGIACSNCAAPLAPDQRYCLECGARTAQLSSTLTRDLRTLVAAPEPATAAGGAAPTGALSPEPARTGGATAVIAGVGVLLLAMGVGVLIGRSSVTGDKAGNAPAQVVSVATPAAAGAATTTSQTPAVSSPTHSSQPSSTKHGAHKSSAEEPSSSGSGVGQTPSKPAPPAAAEHLRGGKGQSYEQKSKNLPNVISTG